MKIVALMAAYNEARFIRPCLEHLARHGVSSYLIDNESTDDTVAQARTFLGRGLIGIETFPRQGRFRWAELLQRKAELAAELEADWFIHLDPDEFLDPPSQAGTLAEAFARESAAGFNAINFSELVFLPTRESPEHDHADFQRTMRWYYPFEVTDHFRTIAWRKQSEPVNLTEHGGHRVEFAGRAISPARFLMRHYLCLGSAHARSKFGGRLYDATEIERGWHGWRAEISGALTFPAAAEMNDRALQGLVFDRPRRKHFWAPLSAARPALRKTWRIEQVNVSQAGGASRVSVDVDGEPLWFESPDTTLRPAIEGFAAMLVLPALALGTRLDLGPPVCPVWLRNLEQFLLVCRGWWNVPGVLPLRCATTQDNAGTASSLTACSFTGGVDSFHTLRCGEKHSDVLFFVHGFDIPLAQTERAEAVVRVLRTIAQQTNRRFVLLRSNAREHHIFSAVNWIQTHGTAIAAAGHLLADQCSTLLIPSSDVPGPEQAWGSHWRTDHLLGSSRLAIHSDAPFVSRVEKIRHLADDPLFRQYVRVCWEGKSAGNCGRCEKCLRTMLALEGVGALENVSAFDRNPPLAERIAGLPSVPHHHQDLWLAALKLPLRPETRRSAEALLKRSACAT